MERRSSGWRRRRRRPTWRGFVGILRNPRARFYLAGVFGALLLTYVGIRLDDFYYSSMWYADMGIGDRRQDVLYGIGAPSEARDGNGPWHPSPKPDMAARAWAYASAAGGRVEVLFDPGSGRATRITCSHADAQPFSCPSLFRINMGADEGTLFRRLGGPSRELLNGETKVMAYDDIGAEYALKRYTVYSITAVTDRSGGLSRIKRFVHNLVP